jgi:hypothetical protein
VEVKRGVNMIEGMKIVFFRIIYGLFIMLIMPIYNFIYNYAIALNPTFCGDSLPIINQGVQAMKWIVFLGIAAGGYHIFYRAVMLRAYESQYSQTMGPFGGR